jgi:hypothetical protein
MSIKLQDNIQNEISGGCGSLAGSCYFEKQRTDSENLMIQTKQHGGKKQKGGTKVMNNVGDVGGEANKEVNDNLQKLLEVGGQMEADAEFDGCIGKTECMSIANGGSRRRNGGSRKRKGGTTKRKMKMTKRKMKMTKCKMKMTKRKMKMTKRKMKTKKNRTMRNGTRKSNRK